MHRKLAHTIQRSGIYQYKRRVPDHLIQTKAFDGKRFIEQSLSTRDFYTARDRVAILDAEFDQRCEMAELEIKPVKETTENADTPTPSQVKTAAEQHKRWFLRENSRDRDLMNNLKWQHLAGEEIVSGTPLSKWQERADEIRGALKGRRSSYVERRVERVSKTRGWHAPPGSPLHDEISVRIAQASLEAIEKLLSTPAGQTTAHHQKPSELAASLSDCVEHYSSAKPSKEEHLKKMRVAVKAWIDLYGDVPVAKIERSQVREFATLLSKVPKALRAKHPGESLKTLMTRPEAANPDQKRLKPQTIKDNYIGPLNSAVGLAKSDDLVAANPFDRFEVDGTDHDPDTRAFHVHEMNRIFRHPIFVGCSSAKRRNTPGRKVIRDHYFWGPLVALWTGMRSDEIAQTLLENVYLPECGYEGKPHIHVPTGKSKNARRDVPIHPELLQCGFGQYVKSLKAKNEEYLFPKWKTPAGKNKSSSASQRNFNSKIVKLCDDDRPTFHSFRHTMKEELYRIGMIEQQQDAVLGHKPTGMSKVYLKNRKLSAYYEKFVQDICFPGLDIEHLKPKNQH